MNETDNRTDAQAPRVHELKTWPEFFAALLDGTKTFEMRRNDRDFRVGDELRLREWIPDREYEHDIVVDGRYTGREMRFRVSYVMRPAAAPGFAVLGLAPAQGEDATAPEQERTQQMLVAASKRAISNNIEAAKWKALCDEQRAELSDLRIRLAESEKAPITPVAAPTEPTRLPAMQALANIQLPSLDEISPDTEPEPMCPGLAHIVEVAPELEPAMAWVRAAVRRIRAWGKAERRAGNLARRQVSELLETNRVLKAGDEHLRKLLRCLLPYAEAHGRDLAENADDTPETGRSIATAVSDIGEACAAARALLDGRPALALGDPAAALREALEKAAKALGAASSSLDSCGHKPARDRAFIAESEARAALAAAPAAGEEENKP